MGGMQRHSRLLAEHLARSGQISLSVIHPHPDRVFDPALGIREVKVPGIDGSKLYFRELWRYSHEVARELDRIRPDVILSQGFCVWSGIDRFSDRLVVMPHGLEMFQGLTIRDRMLTLPFRIALRYILRRSTAVVSLGGRLTGILSELAEGCRCRVVVIPNATEIPVEPVPVTPAARPGLELLFVGRFAFNKGIDVLVEVARRLIREGRGPAVRFRLAGDGPLMGPLRRSGVPENVDLLGRVDDDELSACYASCDALILPTRFEGMPTVVLEAMARAKPVIVSDVGACAELVDMHNGYLLPPGDADALHAAILSLAERPAAVRGTMGQVSLQRVRERFSWPVVTDRYVELIRSFRSVPPPAAGR